jgi:phosphate transport system permease protein
VQRQLVEKDVLGNEKTTRQQYRWLIRCQGPFHLLAGAQGSEPVCRHRQRLADALGSVRRWQKVDLIDTVEAFKDHRRITALATVLGDYSLAVGDEKGQVTTWMPVSKPGSGEDKHLALIHPCRDYTAGQPLLASPRDKSLAVFDKQGTIKMVHMTSERLLLELKAGMPVVAAAFADRGRKLVVSGPDGKDRSLETFHSAP